MNALKRIFFIVEMMHPKLGQFSFIFLIAFSNNLWALLIFRVGLQSMKNNAITEGIAFIGSDIVY